MKLKILVLAVSCVWLAVNAQPAAMQVLFGHVPAAAHSVPLGRLAAWQTLKLAIGLPLRNRAELNLLLRRIYDPASPDYRKYLTPEEFTERFGPTREDYAGLAALVASNSLTITATHPNRLVLDVAAPVAAIEKSFHTTLRQYRHPVEAREFFAPDTEPSLATAIPVLHISGLDDFVRPHPLSRVRSIAATGGGVSCAAGSGPGGGYLGSDFRTAYLPGVTLTGAGQKVGLFEIEAGYAQAAITAYESLAGLASVPVSSVLLDGYNGAQSTNTSEVCLDIETALAMAPGLAGVTVYEGSLGDDILNRMATDNQAKQLSCSWTFPTDATTDQIFQEIAAQGQSFFTASGDGDAWSSYVYPPSDDPNITVVGGTTLATANAGGAWRAEQVWNQGFVSPGWLGTGAWGSAGGSSATYSMPYWQTGVDMTANGGSWSMRNAPDVALTADNIFLTYSNALWGNTGGTSAAAPLWAGLAALMNQQAAANHNPPVGFLNPALYAIGLGPDYTNCFHDIILGNNTNLASPTEFFAVPGYDLCTGWGTPAGQPLIDALAPDALGVSPATGVSANGLSGGPFTNASATVWLTNRGGANLSWRCGNPVPWLKVTPTNGTLLAGESTVSVTLALSGSATNLAAGVYAGTVWFTNLTDGIAQPRHNQIWVQRPTSIGNYGAAILSLQPAGYWPLNETNLPPPADLASNVGSLGLLANGLAFAQVAQGQAGIVSNCAAFSNTNLVVDYLGSHVDVPFNSVLNPAGPFTVEFWAKPNHAPNNYFSPLSSIDATENGELSRSGWLFYESAANQWCFWEGCATGYVAKAIGGKVQTQTWQHVAGVYDGTNVALYVNGVLASGPLRASGYAPNTNLWVPLRLGAATLGNRTFDGSLDELAVFTNAVSAATLYAHYRAATTNNAKYGAQILASHPVGYWHLDEPVYTAGSTNPLPTVLNLGSLGSLAEGSYMPGAEPGAAGVPTAGFGVPNGACAFSGTAYIDVPGFPLGFRGPVTLSAWVKAPSSLGQVQSVAGLGTGGYELTLDAQGRANFLDGPQPLGPLVATNRIDDGRWHQLTGVYDGVESQSLYVDGRLAAWTTFASATPVLGLNDFWIGGDPDPRAFGFFNGTIDEVAVFPEALTANQILWLFSTGFPATQLQVSQSSANTGALSLAWPAIPGQPYAVQYTEDLSQTTWSDLGGPVSATNSSITVSDVRTNASRFYRVVLLP